uniref:DNA (cytosine-5-)-methyltransferase n=1 Tax=Sander lucioperca TaxID=283035 RepID=A0A8C9YXT9_SANLU
MDLNVAVNVTVSSIGRPNLYELLAWLNESLQTGFTKIGQVCTGAAYCQLMDWLFPQTVDLSRVRFQSNDMVDIIHNYSLLQAAFRKLGVLRHIPVKDLMERNSKVAVTFLHWFKVFFDRNNNKGREYHALEARGGQSMVPADSGGSTKTEKMETAVKEEAPKKVEQEVAVDKGNEGTRYSLLHFIRRYCDENVGANFNTSRESQVSAILSPAHPLDIIKACSSTPYCLYLYVGVELGGGQNTGVVLVGYMDQRSGVSVVKPLLTLQMSVDPQSSADTDAITDTPAADTDAQHLIETLKKRGFPLFNIVAFYCNAPHPGVSQVFVSRFQAFNPRLVSLCGLPGMAARACQAGLLASFGCVVDLVRDIHYHYYTCPQVRRCLKELFADAESYNPSHPISAQCLFIIHAVQKMASCWRLLVDYYKSLMKAQDVDQIRTRLMDAKVKLRFMFLASILDPLRALQEYQQGDAAAVSGELQLASMLVHSYATSLFRPSVAEHFLRKRDPHLLQNRTEMLPVAEVHVGAPAIEFMWATAVVDLGEQERLDFLEDAATFYKATLQSLVESLPEHLGEVALRNVDQVLKHPDNINVRRFTSIYFPIGCNVDSIREISVTIPTLLGYERDSQRIKETSRARWPGILGIRKPVQADYGGDKKVVKKEGISSEDSDDGEAKPKSCSSMEDSDYTDNSSGKTVSCDVMGELVWGQPEGFSLWPAIIIPFREEIQHPKSRMVEWYGQNMSSQVRLQALKPLAAFAQHFCSNSFAILSISVCYQEAALRCKKPFSACVEDRDELLKQMLDWAFGGFQPTGPDGLKPTAATNILNICVCVWSAGFCLCCGTEDVEISHPLFQGSLCLECKNNLTETLYRYDEDGYQSYCTICCYGLEVILCGNDSCCRCYCTDCLNILVGQGTFDALKLLDPWICYLCQPHRPHGALIPREDWSVRVQDLFANNSAMEFEPHRVYPSIPANQRRPIRVLSLFDGIATGCLVLKDLGFKVEKYVASEVCEDSISVATVGHDGKIIHVGDVRFITEEHMEQWGPFDLLIGGSPCNDLSMVNPFRKGLYEGTGRLFFEFYRILQLLKPKEEDPRPFFWLFENVVFMNTHDRVNICRVLSFFYPFAFSSPLLSPPPFLCNPVLVDAVKVSPAHRRRYFWGNIPGMSRPIIASQNDKLDLQACLEIGREARVAKVRTITTNPNSLKQGKSSSLLPVLHNGKEDNLWITELEKIFGFPKHYTDVRNMNRQQRQKVLGKAWSVPVIRHLFAPLKDYFACEELPPLSTSATSSSTSPSSPASPELQQLR